MTDVASPGTSFPDGFVFGAATSAIQTGGAWIRYVRGYYLLSLLDNYE